MKNLLTIRLFTASLAFALGLNLATSACGQRPLDRIGQALDDLRPRGEIIRKIFGEEEPAGRSGDRERAQPPAGDERRNAEGLWNPARPPQGQPSGLLNPDWKLPWARNHQPDNSRARSQPTPQRMQPNQQYHSPRSAQTAPNTNWRPNRPAPDPRNYSSHSEPAPGRPSNDSRAVSPRAAQPSFYIPSPQDIGPLTDPRSESSSGNEFAGEASSSFTPIPSAPQPDQRDFMIRSVPVPANAAPERLPPRSVPAVSHGLAVVREGSEEKPIGLRIRSIQRGSPIEKSGLQPNDVIVNIGGVPMLYEQDLDSLMEVLQPGDEMEFTVIRNGQERTVRVQFGDPPAVDPSDLQFQPGNRGGSIGDQSRDLIATGAPGGTRGLRSVLDRTPVTVGTRTTEIRR